MSTLALATALATSLVASLSRENALAALATEAVPLSVLRGAVLAALSGEEPTIAPPAKPGPVAAKPGPVAAKPGPVAAKPGPVAAKPGPVAAKPGPVAAKPATKPGPVAKPGKAKPVDETDPVQYAIAQLAPLGFAAGELGAATGLDPKCSAVRTGLNHAIAAGVIHQAGDRRFSRYGATAKIAQAASDTARGK